MQVGREVYSEPPRLQRPRPTHRFGHAALPLCLGLDLVAHTLSWGGHADVEVVAAHATVARSASVVNRLGADVQSKRGIINISKKP